METFNFKTENDFFEYFSHKFKIPRDIWEEFKEYFMVNIDVINNVFNTKNLYLYEIIFREILSGEYNEIYFENQIFEGEYLEKLRYCLNDPKSELVPDLHFFYTDNNDEELDITSTRSIHLELRKNGNAFA